MTRDELQTLIDAALEGELSEADFIRLEAELSVDPATREEYYRRITLSLLLEQEANRTTPTEASPIPTEASPIVSRRQPHPSPLRMRAPFVAAVVGVCLLIGFGLFFRNTSGTPVVKAPEPPASGSKTESREEVSSGFAILSGQVDAVWNGRAPLPIGGVVPPGELHLHSGFAQFELFSGVSLVVEGQARFSILSPMEIVVTSGQVRAHVPQPARGFRVLTGSGNVVDLGTEFAVRVEGDAAEIHVLQGEVEWHPNGHRMERLTEGEATRSTTAGPIRLAAQAERFVGPNELRQRLTDRRRSRIDRWRTATRELSTDSDLIAHYQLDADQVGRRQLLNLATAAESLAGEGAVVAASATPNRWGNSGGALDFSPAASRVRLRVPGSFQNLTLIAWVRINSLDRWYNSLFLTDGHDRGEPHWQIMDDGRLFFSVKKNDVWDESLGEKDKHIFYSPPFWRTDLSGRWLMLATVYDGTSGHVTHYLDGERLNREAIPPEYLVSDIRIGDASLCNWGLPERDQPRFAVRNLNGALDEFLMFRRPLGETEIHELYRLGRP